MAPPGRATEVIDATQKACCARFINHSCEPNCVTQKWLVKGELCIVIFTSVFVAAGEELTYNYNLDYTGRRVLRWEPFCVRGSGYKFPRPWS